MGSSSEFQQLKAIGIVSKNSTSTSNGNDCAFNTMKKISRAIKNKTLYCYIFYYMWSKYNVTQKIMQVFLKLNFLIKYQR